MCQGQKTEITSASSISSIRHISRPGSFPAASISSWLDILSQNVQKSLKNDYLCTVAAVFSMIQCKRDLINQTWRSFFLSLEGNKLSGEFCAFPFCSLKNY